MQTLELARAIPLEFTPLEFETLIYICFAYALDALEFTPLEFETTSVLFLALLHHIRIYSIGV